jgi:hypothetical protein
MQKNGFFYIINYVQLAIRLRLFLLNFQMNSIAFIDTEIEPRSRKILDIGGVKDDGNRFIQTQ